MTNTIQNAIFNDQSGIQEFASYFKNAVFNDKKCILNSVVSKNSILNGF